jgi:hypothetical protein
VTDRPRPGRPPASTPGQRAEVVAAALATPGPPGRPFAAWTRDRVRAYRTGREGIGVTRTRTDGSLVAEGLRWREPETGPGHEAGPAFAPARGRPRRPTRPRPTARPSPAPTRGGRSRPRASRAPGGPAGGRSRRRPTGGGARGACPGRPSRPPGPPSPADAGRATANRTDFLGRADARPPAGVGAVCGVLDNRAAHRSTDPLLVGPAHPRWEFASQPVAAADPSRIEPWWTAGRSVALGGRRLETWPQVGKAVGAAAGYGNARRHPLVWGRRRPRPRRAPGIASVPGVR